MFLHPDFVKMVVAKLPEAVRVVLQADDGVCVAGGFLRDVLTGQEPKDIDLFGVDAAALDAGRVKFAQNAPPVYAERETKNAYTWTSSMAVHPTVQFVNRTYYPTHMLLILSFDFSICQAAVYWNDFDKVWVGICTELFLADTTEQKMTYIAPERDEDPGASVLRMVKFAARGYHIDQENIAKVVGRFTGKLYDEWEDTAVTRVRTAFKRVGYGWKQKEDPFDGEKAA